MADLTGKTLGNYRIVEQIGRGGMATVYKAYQPALERYVAIKVIHEQLAAQDEQFFKRFQREAKSVASLRHPGIVQIFDFGIEENVSYMVMEYLQGTSLKAELKELSNRGEVMSQERMLHIFQSVANAVDYACSQGMAHRDIKPDNVMLTTKGDVILTDFGIARIVGGTQYTATGSVIGTPAYMSPEQGKGERGDERSDIYSLGVLLYEMVTGRVPFEADTPLAVIFKHISDPLPLPRDLNPSIPENVEQVILKSLAKNPDDRYQRAVDMVTALVDAVSAETVKSDRKADISKAVIADKTMLSSDPPLESIASPSIQYAPPLTGQPSRLAGISLWVWVIGGGIAVVLLIAIVGVFGFLVMKKAESSTPNTSIVVRAATAPGVVVSSSTPTTTPMPSPTFTPIATDTYTPLPTPTNTFTPSPSPTDTPTSTPTSEPISTPQMNLSQNIDDFENFNTSLDGGFEINRNAGNGGQVKLAGIPHVGQGRQALALEFDIQNSPPNHYIGFDRTLPPQDWSDYTSICFWIESDGSNRSLVLQFGESKFKFWKNIYSLSNGTGDYCISLDDPHQINLRSIGYYGVYVEGPPIGQSIIYIDNVRLVKQ